MLYHTQLCFKSVIVVLSLSILSVCALENENFKKPNIVFILADDLGFDDVSFRGSNEFLTPNIDALGYHGRILNQFYAHSICTPSRSALLTGLNPIHAGNYIITHLNGLSNDLSLNFTLMPEILKNAGYSTNLIGKWNLGHARKENTPTFRGFDNHYGFWGAEIDHFTRRSHMPICNLTTGYDFRRNMNLDCENMGSYVTELFTAEAERIITNYDEEKQKKPLFLLIAHSVPHSPLQAPEEELKKFNYIKNPARRIYAAMVSLMDRSVGRVIRALERAELLENSIIIFSSDNGGVSAGIQPSAGSNWPLRGQKDTPWEGGIRLPAVIWSPLLGTSRQHIFYSPFYMGDWLPTLANAANIELPITQKIDGQNMWPDLKEENSKATIKERTILHVLDPLRHVVAYRRGAWKYLNGTMSKGQFDNVLTFREYDDIDARAQRYVVEVRNSLTSKALSKFDEQRLTQSRIENLRRNSFINCGEIKHACNPLVEECLFNIELDPCEQNNLIYDERYKQLLIDMRAEILALKQSALPVSRLRCSMKEISDPSLHNCAWTNYLDEPASLEPQRCTNAGPPCGAAHTS